MSLPPLLPATHPPSAILGMVEYFEIDSEIAGKRYGVWVSVPEQYATEPERRFPAIFSADGNYSAPLFLNYNRQLPLDPIHPILPYVHIIVGYCGSDVAKWAMELRTRDLIPPGEPPSPNHLAMLDAHIAQGGQQAVALTALRRAVENGGRADLFLRFIAEELYPQIIQRWRIDACTCGLFGYSYGGLFTAWVAMQNHALFRRYGAGSSSVLTSESKVFELMRQQAESGADHGGNHLHLTVCDLELTVPSVYQSLGVGFARMVEHLGFKPIKGLKVTSQIIPNESHKTGQLASWFSFMRACYSAK